MTNRYIKYPYEKEFISEIDDSIEIDGKVFKSPTESIIFLGNNKVEGDEFKINSEKVEIYQKEGKIYFNNDSEILKQTLNYDHRLDIMQQSLANAIVRLCINRATDLKIKDFKVNKKSNNILIEAKDISYSMIERIEELSNYLTFSNALVYNNAENNIIKIEGMGDIEYFGPSLKRTGEVGIIKINNIEKRNSSIILEIVGGQRALKEFKNKSRTIQNLKSILFLNNEDNILKEVKRLKSNGEELKVENKKMEDALGLDQIKDYKKLATNVEGINYIYKVINNVNFKDLKNISSYIMKDLNYVQIYGIPNGSKSQIMVSRSQNLNFNLKEIMDKISKKIPMNGTGNIYTITANLDSIYLASAMESFLIEIKNLNN
ncbi:MAG: hypothetical protein ACTHWZ_00795 [Peptoniphilaceae bacterium]